MPNELGKARGGAAGLSMTRTIDAASSGGALRNRRGRSKALIVSPSPARRVRRAPDVFFEMSTATTPFASAPAARRCREERRSWPGPRGAGVFALRGDKIRCALVKWRRWFPRCTCSYRQRQQKGRCWTTRIDVGTGNGQISTAPCLHKSPKQPPKFLPTDPLKQPPPIVH